MENNYRSQQMVPHVYVYNRKSEMNVASLELACRRHSDARISVTLVCDVDVTVAHQQYIKYQVSENIKNNKIIETYM